MHSLVLGNAAEKRAETLGAVVRERRSPPAQANETVAQHSESANWQRTSQTENTAEKCNCSIRTRKSTKSSDTPAAQVGKTSRRSRCAAWWSQCCSMENAPPVGKIRQSGDGLPSEACWDVVRQHHFPYGEQVSRLASDPRDEARQAHGDDRENLMTSLENWLRTDCRAASNWCKGVDNAKIAMVHCDDGTHSQC